MGSVGVPGEGVPRRSSCGGRVPEGVGVPGGGPSAGRGTCGAQGALPGAEAGAGRMGSGGRPRRRRRHAGAGPVAVAGRCGRSSRRSAAAPRAHTVGSVGVPGECVPCRPSCGGRTRRVAACLSGAPSGPWDLRLAGSVARGLRPGPGVWAVASTDAKARGERGAVCAGRPVAGGLTESPTRRGRRACRGRTPPAGRAAAGARAGHRRAR